MEKKVSGTGAGPKQKYRHKTKRRSTTTKKAYDTVDTSAPSNAKPRKENTMPLIDTKDAYWLWMLLWDGIACVS